MPTAPTITAQHLVNSILAEAGLNYTLPSSPKTLMADFYLCSYLVGTPLGRIKALASEGAMLFSHESDATFAAAEAAAAKLYPFLKKHLLEAVLFSMGAEIRHLADLKQDYKQFSPDAQKFVRAYFQYYSFYNSNVASQLRTSRDKIDRKFSKENRGYQDSLKAVLAAARRTGIPMPAVVGIFERLFDEGSWNSSYGGKQWAKIAKAWVRLYNVPETDLPESAIKIDVVYDLQHNTGTVFTKLTAYADKGGGYAWVKEALDYKANLKNPRELLRDASSDMRKLGARAFHMLGTPELSNTPSSTPTKSTKKASAASILGTPSQPAPQDKVTGSGFVWNDGVWDGKKPWKDGTWKNGTWENGVWEDGTFESGLWEEGTWMKGTWSGTTWENGVWKNGVWKKGWWHNGTWENGTWENGWWDQGTWNGGTWVKGKIKDPDTLKYVESTVSPATYYASAKKAKGESQPSAPVAPAAPPAPATENQSAIQLLNQLVESLLTESPRLATLKAHKVKLSASERNEIINAGAVWSQGPHGARSPGVWKSVVKGKTWYGCSTHRAYQVKPTLRGAISAFKFIKTTA